MPEHHDSRIPVRRKGQYVGETEVKGNKAAPLRYDRVGYQGIRKPAETLFPSRRDIVAIASEDTPRPRVQVLVQL